MGPLEDLLDRVAEALLVGDLAALGFLTPAIEQCTATSLHPDRAAAARLVVKAQRNGRLLDAASRGVSAARQRVTEITRGPALTTYDARGMKAVIAPIRPDAAHRV
jgi:hypothetical protein